LVDSLEATVNRLSKQLGKFLIVEDVEVTAWWYLANGCRMPSISLITVGTLNKDSTVAQTFSKHFSSHIVQLDTFANMSPCQFSG
jgi:hypothetical protein